MREEEIGFLADVGALATGTASGGLHSAHQGRLSSYRARPYWKSCPLRSIPQPPQ
jgi:hypothetical protein